jgi:hypothetical protein
MTNTSIMISTVDRVISFDWNLLCSALVSASSALVVRTSWCCRPYHMPPPWIQEMYLWEKGDRIFDRTRSWGLNYIISKKQSKKKKEDGYASWLDVHHFMLHSLLLLLLALILNSSSCFIVWTKCCGER